MKAVKQDLLHVSLLRSAPKVNRKSNGKAAAKDSTQSELVTILHMGSASGAVLEAFKSVSGDQKSSGPPNSAGAEVVT